MNISNIFGTDGIRDHVGTGLLTLDKLPILGKALATWACDKYQREPHVLLIHDTRISCSFIKAALTSGLLLSPIKLYNGGILPTPAGALIAHYTKLFDCVLIISASHNPWHDNGIKIIDGGTGKLTFDDERVLVERIVHYSLNAPSSNNKGYQTLGQEVIWTTGEDTYCSFVTSLFSSHMLTGKKIILDTANGASYRVAPRIFSVLGAQVITLNNIPNGVNINQACGTQYLDHLQQEVIKNQADMGFAFDGDGDRVIAVNHEGEIKNGDDILALLLAHPEYSTSTKIVGTVMSNQAFEKFLEQQGKQLVRTPVGDKYIVEQLIQQRLLIGGEPSGHIILNPQRPIGDGIITALKLIETLSYSDNWSMRTFAHYPQILINVPVNHKYDLEHPLLADSILQAQSHLTNGRLLVRYSGTEPLLRIMVEDISHHHATQVAHNVAYTICQILEKTFENR